jgi:Tol biopolymer transport system component
MNFKYKIRPILIIFIVLFVFQSNSIYAKYGKNKVQYEDFTWQYIQSPHFDVYYSEGGRHTAVFAAEIAEKAYTQISYQIDWDIAKRISIIVYNSHNDFQQTNVTLGYLYEGIGGFTELYKNRIVVPFEGNYEDFRHVVHHELTHAVLNDYLYGGSVQSLVSGQVKIDLPLWLSEGYAEYSSRDWDSNTDMIIRDAIINDLIPPIQYLSNYMAYKGGQSVLRHIGETYGIKKIADLMGNVKHSPSFNKALQKTIGKNLEKFGEEWKFSLRKAYWPEIEDRQILNEVGRKLTDHVELKNYFNTSPAISPNGGKVAFLSDRNGYADIFLLKMNDTEPAIKILSGQKTAALEEMKWLSPGIDWSPDNEEIVFAAKAGSEDALTFYNTATKKQRQVKLGLDGISTARWSPDNEKIVFAGLNNGATDIYIYTIKDGSLMQMTNDYFSDADPSWSPDSKKVVFVSDRQEHLNMDNIDTTSDSYMVNHHYRNTDIYVLNVATKEIERITTTEQDESSPIFFNTSNALAYTSDRNGIWNIYRHDLNEGISVPLTDVLAGVFQLSICKDDSRLIFSGYEKGGWDIYSLNNPLEIPSYDALRLSTYLTRDDLQFSLDYTDSLNNPEIGTHNQYENYVFGQRNIKIDQANKPLPGDGVLSDEITYLDSNGAYKSHPYKTKFTVDLVDGQTGFTNYFGLQGNALLIFSDLLGNHQIQFGFELNRNLENSDLILGYSHLAKRMNYSMMAFNYPDIYQLDYYRFLLFRQYGISVSTDYPLSKFSRFDLGLSWMNIYKRDFELISSDEIFVHQEETQINIIPSVGATFDNVIYGYLYPVNGWRGEVKLVTSPMINETSRQFTTISTDIRRYFKVFHDYSFAFRLSSALSVGKQPLNFVAGGVSNWLNYDYDRANIQKLYNNENDQDALLYSDYVYPLRGAKIFELIGDHYTMFNAEFRFPFIEYISMKWPISMVMGNIQGLIFADAIRMWDIPDGATNVTKHLFKTNRQNFVGTGTGVRANLGIFVLRYDLAYKMGSDLSFGRPQHLWSLGLDF